MKKIHIILLVVIAAGVAFLLADSFAGSVTRYASFAEAKTTGDDVHVIGQWVKREQASYDTENDVFSFYMQDDKGDVHLVHYHDPKPANFERAEKAVVIGRFEGDAFHATGILTKCESKYQETNVQAADAAQ